MKGFMNDAVSVCYVIVVIVLCSSWFWTIPWRTDEKTTTRVLIESGYKPLKVGGFGWFQAEKDEWYSTKFIAISPHKDTVSGVVNSGLLFKGSFIRLN